MPMIPDAVVLETAAAIVASQIKPIVTPLCVFAPGRDSFDAIVRVPASASRGHIKAVLFEKLRLASYGWDFEKVSLYRQRSTDRGEQVWHLSRPQVVTVPRGVS